MPWFDFAILMAALLVAAEILRLRRRRTTAMKHKTIILFRGDAREHGVFLIGTGDWQYRRDPYHACGGFRVLPGNGVEIGPFTSTAPDGASASEKQAWMARNWLASRRAFRSEGFDYWTYERLEEDGTFSTHKELLTGVSEPANISPPPEGNPGVHAMPQSETVTEEVTETITAENTTGDEPQVFDLNDVDIKVCEPRDVANDDRLEIHVVRYFKGKKRPGFWLSSGWDGSEKAIDGIQAFLGLNVGEAFKQMQSAKDSAAKQAAQA